MPTPKLHHVLEGFDLSPIPASGTVDDLKAYVAKLDSQQLFWHILPATNAQDVKLVAMGMDKRPHYCITDFPE